MTRKEARDLAFKLIYQTEMQKETPDYILETFYIENVLAQKDKEYIEGIVSGVYENKQTIYSSISELLYGWKIERISKISLCVIMLSVYEILYCDDIPDSVSINEAVSLAKTYESNEAASFVNGILSSVLKQKEADK